MKRKKKGENYGGPDLLSPPELEPLDKMLRQIVHVPKEAVRENGQKVKDERAKRKQAE